MIISGKDGQVLYDPNGITPIPLLSVSGFKVDMKTDKLPTTVFGANNKTYVLSLPDINGTYDGFYDGGDLTLWLAAQAISPGLIKLLPHTSEPGNYWQGKTYIDASIDTDVNGVPKVTGSFVAADSWHIPGT